jgi:imidazolonepropionase-like amidohydrolase
MRGSLMRVIRKLLVVAVALVLAGGCTSNPQLVARDPGSSRSLVMRNVRVFDAPRAALLDGVRDVVVRDGKIDAIGAPGLADAGLQEIDGRGKILLPGLIDVHTHTGSSSSPPWHVGLPDLNRNLAGYLYAGVTTVLDLGGLSPAVFRERENIATGKILGPRVYAAGPMFTAPGGHPAEVLRDTLPWYLRWYVVPRATREVATPEDARRAVSDLLPEHPDILKIALDAGGNGDVPCLRRDTIAAITAAGHAAGIRSIAHIGSSAEAIEAVKGGVDALAHAPWREEVSDDAVRVIATAHVSVIVTLAVWDVAGSPRSSRADFLPIEVEVAGPKLIAELMEPPPPLDDLLSSLARAAAAAHDARYRNVGKLRAAGVQLLAGSDACNPNDLPGAGLHLELAKLVDAGVTPGEALRMATSENAHFLAGDGADFGEVAVGKRADLVLVKGDPTAHIGDLGKITEVILDGAILERHPAR